MAITIIPNQPVRFTSSETECACLGQEYSQLVNKNDATQFQIKSSNAISNGGFGINLDGWNVFEAIDISALTTNETAEGACDGEIAATATGGTAPYTYSIDGGAFGSGTFTNLCSGTYLITAKDANGNEGSVSVTIVENIVCGDYEGSYTDDLLSLQTSQLINCYTDNFI